jgi:hypothetical protein
MSNLKYFSQKVTSLVLVFLCMFLSIVLPIEAQVRQANLVIQPGSGKAAIPIKIIGSNFLPNEEVDIIMQVGDIFHGLGTGRVDVVISDSNGNFDIASGIPHSTPPGIYKVEATGKKGSVGSFNIEVIK